MSPAASQLQISVNGEPRMVAAGASVTDLLVQMDRAGKRLAVERNGEIVPRGVHSITQLGADDKLEIVVAVGGG
jgi:sulfur carrier protein